MNGERSYNGYGYNEDGTDRQRDDLEANAFSRNENPSYSTLDSYEDIAKQEEQEYLAAEETEAIKMVSEARETIKELNKKLDQIENELRASQRNIGASALSDYNRARTDNDAQELQNPPERNEEFVGYGLTKDGLVAKRGDIVEMDNE